MTVRTATLTLTATMLDKGIIDATTEAQDALRSVFDYDSVLPGGRATVPVTLDDKLQERRSLLSMYRAKGRGDERLWLGNAAREVFRAGDTVELRVDTATAEVRAVLIASTPLTLTATVEQTYQFDLTVPADADDEAITEAIHDYFDALEGLSRYATTSEVGWVVK